MSSTRILSIVAALAAVLVLADSASAQRIAPDARGYARFLARQQPNSQARAAATVASNTNPGTYTWYVPPSVPTDRTYTWYAPPAEFQVVIQATSTEPRYITVVGPDGTKRTFRAEGPIVIRRPVVVRR